MSITDRILVAVGIMALVLLAAGAGTAAWLAYGYGTMEVDVHSSGPGGSDLSMRLPGALVRIAAAFVPGDVLREPGRKAVAWLSVVRAGLSELRRCPDARLLDIRSRGETVRITKRGSTLLAEVRSATETVRVVIPLRAAAAAIEVLGDSGDGQGDASRE
ncbi:MAG: hypothetical protein LAO51_08405 [Acidobacteriia bacterium]|nr:hypothetical protein [Terriglobia bacterium]